LVYIKKGAQLNNEGQTRYNKNLILWGVSIKTAGMDHYSRPFVIGLLIKCRRDILPALSANDLRKIENDGYIAMLSRKYKGKANIPEQKLNKPKHFYQIGKIKPWMMP
jgi:hypothetical protein